ncbi:DoxX family protein [Coraliomargarita parva]|uniref:DoxX family protein n=1 Tax=Coraliomargarita parva TaxID=3014050 RepID=UPI0022B3852F|nr:DoxX family protein [Coraliomargarita parva]
MKLKTVLLGTTNSLAFLPLRIGVGLVMAGHGAQKLFGWFGGYGLQGTGQFFAENLGLKPGVLMAAFAGGTEFFGGVLLLLGLLTRLAGLSLVGTMLVAIITAHPDAFFASDNGMEYPLTLLLASLTLTIGGAGALSVDRQLVK